jgi:hypothetical protein
MTANAARIVERTNRIMRGRYRFNILGNIQASNQGGIQTKKVNFKE